MTPPIHLIGAPADAGAGVRGCSMGPEALRVAGIAGALQRLGLTVHDRGNLTGPVTPRDRPPAPHRNLAEVVAWNRALFEAVGHVLDTGGIPLTMGGDHCLAIGSISAVAAHCRRQGRHLRVVWLDAHTDVNTEATSPSGNLHGMPVACLLGHGPAALTGWSGAAQALRPQDIGFVGIRSVDPGERAAIRDFGLSVYDMRYIDEHGMRAAMTEVLMEVDENTHLHVSFDVDCLDPADAPGVGTAVRGGPTYREMQLCMEMLADTGRLGSLDLVEVNPAFDLRNRTADVAVELVQSLFGRSTL